MTDETGKEQSATWPNVKFSFRVKIGDAEILFQEVTGLNAETPIIEYRAGSSKEFSTIKMPGIKKYANVILKKGIFKNDKMLWDVQNLIATNSFEPQIINISLLDETNKEMMNWELANAFPCNMEVTNMKQDVNFAAVEIMELAHEGFNISK